MSTARSGTTQGLEDSAEGKLVPARMEARQGPGQGAAVALTEAALVVGKAEGCDLRLEDAAVSARHATVELLRGAVRVRDLGSKNGTLYLGARIDEAIIPLGGEVRVGRTTLAFVPSVAAAPLSSRSELGQLRGESTSMRRLYAMLEALARSDTTALFVGETGSGKEAAARALHALAFPAPRPFVVFDCGAASPELMESQLFGHVRGAFTGADRDQPGAVASAADGTLFLDEVTELPLELQPKLLRLCETREYRPVGSSTQLKAACRLVASTQKEPLPEVEKGRLRKDLYFRLAVAVVNVPPLRSRASDIPLLARHFARELSGVEVALAPATLAALQCHPWPGNVRELRNAVERVLHLGDAASAEPQVDEVPSYRDAREQLLEAFEGDYLRALIARNGGNVSAAAREAKVSRRQFYRMLERHGLSAERS